mgnify:CR=1 FL=1
MMGRNRWVVITVVVLHTLLLLAYTLPVQFIPGMFRSLSIAYARPLFHQSWQLFAPDPPPCSCTIEVIMNENDIRPIDQDRGYLEHRMAQTIARSIQSELAQGDSSPRPELVRAMKRMVGDIERELGVLEFQLHEECIVDPQSPTERIVRITKLKTADQ